MNVNSSVRNNVLDLGPKTQEILSQIDDLSPQHDAGNAVVGVQNHLALLKAQIDEVLREIEDLLSPGDVVHNAMELEALEKAIVCRTDRLAGVLIGYKVQQAIDSEELAEESRRLIDACPKKLKNQGRREVSIQPLRGEAVRIKTGYFSQKGKKDKRTKKRRGVYPTLILLGMYEHYTPGITSEISLFATVTSSFEEARQLLKAEGHEFNIKTIRAITLSYAARARAALHAQEGGFPETLSGCRVVISTDGGRVRIRHNKKGAKTKKGRRRYYTNWREPKLFIIYVANQDGTPDRTFAPFLDGTVKGPDAIFWLLTYYLSQLQIGHADHVIFVADGARWIWRRVGALLASFGLVPGRWYELVDFYHAVEHLGKVAGLQKGWKTPQKKRWVTKYRRLLLQGAINEVIAELRRLCRGKRSKKLRTERDYFLRNRSRMNYAEIRQKGFPIGSGAMESAIRRVVNLRLKGASIYWLRDNVEAMLLLRSYFKAGRWDTLKQFAYSTVLPEVI